MRTPAFPPAATSAATILLLLSVLAGACADGPTQPGSTDAVLASVVGTGGDPTAVCSPLSTVPLRMENGGPIVGEVRVGNDESHVLVTLETADDWLITKSQLFVGTSAADIPTSRRTGGAVAGRFPYSNVHRGGTTSFTYDVPLAELGASAGQTVVIAVRADIVPGDRGAGAWGDGEPIGSDGMGGSYFGHELAECVSVPVTPGEGGTLVLGGLVLMVPAGAVREIVQITGRQVDASELALPPAAVDAGIIPVAGTAYDLGPDGLEFLAPASLSIVYDDAAVEASGVPESALGLYAVNGIFFGLESAVNAQANRVSAQVDHFTTFFVGGQPPVPDLQLMSFGFDSPTPKAGFPMELHAIARNLATSAGSVDATLRFDFDLLVSYDAATLPAGCVPTASGDPAIGVRIECALGAIDPGVEVGLDLSVVPYQLGTHTVTATLLPVTDDPTPDGNTRTDSFVAIAAEVDLAVEVVAPTVVDPDEVFVVQASIVNHGPDVFPAGTALWIEVTGDAAFVSSDCTHLGSGGGWSVVLQCSVGELAPNASRVFISGLQATAPAQIINTSVRLPPHAYIVDTDGTNDAASADTRVRADLEADLSVAFTPLTQTTAKAGLSHGYFVQVASAGGSADAVPDPGLTLVIAGPVEVESLPADCSASSTTVPAATTITCALPGIAPGETLPVMLFVVQAASSAIGGNLDATATVTLPDGGVDPDPTDNTADHVAAVVAPAVDMYVAQLAESADPIDEGTSVRYTVQAGNRTTATDAAPDGSRIDLLVTAGHVAVISLPAGCTDFSDAEPEPVHVGCETGLLDYGELSPAYEIELQALSAGTIELRAEARPFNGAIEEVPADNTQTETTTVEPAASVLTGKLLFMSDREAYSTIFIKDLASGSITRFTAGGQSLTGRRPVWSPDGNTIAQIFLNAVRLMAADGLSTPVQVPLGDDKSSANHPRWSPDGTRIVFSALPEYGTAYPELYVVELATGIVTRLTNNQVSDEWPDWGSDGRILFVRGRTAIRAMDADGSNDVELRSGGSVRHARWSPDGTQVAFALQQTSGWSIEKFAVASPATLTTLVDDGRENHSPTWSRDGVHIAFVKVEPPYDYQGIYYIAADGSGTALLLESYEFFAEDIDPDWWQPEP